MHEQEPDLRREALQNDVSDGSKSVGADTAVQSKKKRVGLLKRVSRIVVGLLVFLILLPLVVYIPPVQSLLKEIACSVASDATGMDISIDRFGLKFPLDVSLCGVTVVEQSGDTMLHAGEAVVDVKLIPLLDMQVVPQKLQLHDCRYRMLSADSSMLLNASVDYVKVGGRSLVDLGGSSVDVGDIVVKGGDVSLAMDVWKAKPAENDSTAAKWMVKAGNIELEDIRFAMTMLPTIDTLKVAIDRTVLRNGVVDLVNNHIKAGYIATSGGDFSYLLPPSDYKLPAQLPVDTIVVKTPPMTIEVDSIAVDDYHGVYAVNGSRPGQGLDVSHITISNLGVGVADFSMKGSDIRVPLQRLTVKERCGLEVTDAHGVISLTDNGIKAEGFRLTTANSQIAIDADVSNGVMVMQKDAPFELMAEASVGFGDLYCVMPMLQKLAEGVPTHNPLQLDIDVEGCLQQIDVKNIDLQMRDYLSLMAHGEVTNPMDIAKSSVFVEMQGRLDNTSLVNRLVHSYGVDVPALSIDGRVEIGGGNYAADLALLTERGDVVVDGALMLGSESYRAEVSIDSLQMRAIMPALELGTISAELRAEGSGFDPLNQKTWTSINLDVTEAEFKGHHYGELEASLSLEDGRFDADIICYDPYADFDLRAVGNIVGKVYSADVDIALNHVDMQALGLSDLQSAGGANISLQCTAEPTRSIYDIDMSLNDIEWSLPDRYIHLPDGLSFHFASAEQSVNMNVVAPNMRASFDSPYALDTLVNRVMIASDTLMRQVDRKHVSVEDLRRHLPQFNLSLNAAGKGLFGQMLGLAGVAMDSIDVRLRKAEGITMNGAVKRISVASITFDTVMMQVKDRGRMLDYGIHVGNKRGTLDEFAQVDVKGYLGDGRASVSLTQKNITGEIGYRLGATAALRDSVVSVHFTPLNATIGYMPWTLNDDNHVDYHMKDNRIDANLEAMSNDSHICLNSVSEENGNALQVNLSNIHIEDFLQLYAFAPPVKGSLSSDMKLVFRQKGIGGKGEIGVEGLTYDRQRIGDFDFEFMAGMGSEGRTGARVSLLIDKQKVLTGYGIANLNDSIAEDKTRMGLTLTDFPLRLANAFLGKDVAKLGGVVNGEMTMDGSLTKPQLNGDIRFHDASVFLPIMGSSLRLDSVDVPVKDNIIHFDHFKVKAANNNPLVVDGTVDARDFTNIGVDLRLSANELQVINNDKRAKSDIYGKLFMSLSATAKGRLNQLDINAKASVLPATDVYYTIPDAQAMISEQTSQDVVRFVQLSDTTKVVADSVSTAMAMRINAALDIVNGAKATVNLSASGSDRVQVLPSGSLVYSQSYMGDTRLNGQLNIGGGTVRYTPPIMGEKLFEIQPDSYILWNGEMMNPILNLKAVNKMKATVNMDGQNSRVVNFDITLAVTNTLSNMGILFDVSTNDDATVQNQLKTMSDDQRSTQAMNMLITNTYSGNVAASAASLGENALYSFLTSKLNSWAASNIRGVDLSFGIDQYNKTIDGRNSSSMSYSYQVSKSLFDNKFKIVVGGNYTTDASADENFAQNLISDISFEYTLRQTSTLNMYFKLFRHSDFESILEGEITEMGAGFVLKHRIANFYHLFRPVKRNKPTTAPDDSIDSRLKELKREALKTSPDSILGDEIPENDGYDELN